MIDDPTFELPYPGPIENAEIQIYDDAEHNNEVASIVTNIDGMAQTNLIDGEYWFEVTAGGFSDYLDSFTVDGQAEHVHVGMEDE